MHSSRAVFPQRTDFVPMNAFAPVCGDIAEITGRAASLALRRRGKKRIGLGKECGNDPKRPPNA